jgi:hypothetical protein
MSAKIQIGLEFQEMKELGLYLEDFYKKMNYKYDENNLIDGVVYDFIDNYTDQCFNGLSNIISFPYSVVIAFKQKYRQNKEIKCLAVFEKIIL